MADARERTEAVGGEWIGPLEHLAAEAMGRLGAHGIQPSAAAAEAIADVIRQAAKLGEILAARDARATPTDSLPSEVRDALQEAIWMMEGKASDDRASESYAREIKLSERAAWLDGQASRLERHAAALRSLLSQDREGTT